MSKETEPTYDREELVQNAQALFNVNPEVLVGALHGSDKIKLTIDEARRSVDQFLKRKVN